MPCPASCVFFPDTSPHLNVPQILLLTSRISCCILQTWKVKRADPVVWKRLLLGPSGLESQQSLYTKKRKTDKYASLSVMWRKMSMIYDGGQSILAGLFPSQLFWFAVSQKLTDSSTRWWRTDRWLPNVTPELCCLCKSCKGRVIFLQARIDNTANYSADTKPINSWS